MNAYLSCCLNLGLVLKILFVISFSIKKTTNNNDKMTKLPRILLLITYKMH